MVGLSLMLGSTIITWQSVYLTVFISLIIFFLVYKEYASTDVSKQDIDSYINMAVISTLGCHCFYLLVNYLAKTKVRTGIPYLNFLYLENQNLVDSIVAYLLNFSTLLIIFLISTLPLLFWYVCYFGQEMKFEIDKLLIPSYIRVLQIILIYAITTVFCNFC